MGERVTYVYLLWERRVKDGRVTACDAVRQQFDRCVRSYDCGGSEEQLQCDGGSLGECRRVVGLIVVADVCGAGT